jgi:hypothetical protein
VLGDECLGVLEDLPVEQHLMREAISMHSADEHPS